MNHDYAHCLEYKKGKCLKKTCFRAELVEDLKNYIGDSSVVTWASLKGTKYCEMEWEQNRMNDDTISRQAAIDAIYEAFCYAYCDNCEKEMNEDLCGDCHRKYQNWAASKKIISKTINSLPSAEQHEHITSEKDETFRIASEIRLAVSCNTAQECWELARKGDIQRVQHGKWIDPEDLTCYKCSVCGEYATQEYGLTEPIFWHYCPNCGALMSENEE